MTHRDIGKVIPSVADLYRELMQVSSDDIDLHYLGALNSEWCERGMRMMIAFRDAGNEHRFFDIHFAPFQNDPLPVNAQISDFLGEPLTQERKSVVEGKSVTVRVALGCRRIRKTNNNKRVEA